jgi:hypothetical protein
MDASLRYLTEGLDEEGGNRAVRFGLSPLAPTRHMADRTKFSAKEKRQTESGSRAYLLRPALGNVAGFCLTGGGLRRQWGTALCKGAAGIEVKV